jgi:hypothetical protein
MTFEIVKHIHVKKGISRVAERYVSQVLLSRVKQSLYRPEVAQRDPGS